MRTSEEKLTEIRRREKAIRAHRYHRSILLLSSASAAAVLFLVAALIRSVPGTGTGDYEMSAGYASVFSDGSAAGAVLVVLVAFALGVCVTLLALKVHEHDRRDGRR
jgi:hypothetical protein